MALDGLAARGAQCAEDVACAVVVDVSTVAAVAVKRAESTRGCILEASRSVHGQAWRGTPVAADEDIAVAVAVEVSREAAVGLGRLLEPGRRRHVADAESAGRDGSRQRPCGAARRDGGRHGAVGGVGGEVLFQRHAPTCAHVADAQPEPPPRGCRVRTGGTPVEHEQRAAAHRGSDGPPARGRDAHDLGAHRVGVPAGSTARHRRAACREAARLACGRGRLSARSSLPPSPPSARARGIAAASAAQGRSTRDQVLPSQRSRMTS